MAIAPSTIIKFLKDCPLDNSYDHTLYFDKTNIIAGKEAQYNYFNSLVKPDEPPSFTRPNITYTLTEQMYQRVNKNSVRVQIPTDFLYDCNYIMFQNKNFGKKWFYAFISSVNYVNNAVSEVTYEIDVMQSWYFDYNLKECFVKREHSVTDNLYENLMPEGFNEGELYIDYTNDYKVESDNGNYICLMYNADAPATAGGEPQPVSGTVYGGVYSGCAIIASTNPADINNKIASYSTGGLDSIVGIFMCPFNPTNPETQIAGISYDRPTTLNGYTPRNKKLLTYPYCCLRVSNNQDKEMTLNYENFAHYSGDSITPTNKLGFSLKEWGGCNPGISVTPVDYNGYGHNGSVAQNIQFDRALNIDNFVQCGWTGNTFANYMSTEYQKKQISAIASAVIKAGVGLATANPIAIVGGMATLAGTTVNLETEKWIKSKSPAETNGTGASGGLSYALNYIGYTFKFMAIKPEIAKSIDDYFDMFGYATNKLKVPNISSRPHWNYVQTTYCEATGSMPVNDMSKIKDIFNKGITFWKNGNEVGNYSLNNKPV